MNWRWYLFWIKDFVTGGEIYNAYKDIKQSYYEGNKNLHDDISKLLKHAVKTTKYYEKYNYNDINNFPVINKQIIIENYENIKSSMYVNKKMHKMSTSGSTGIPFTVIQDINKRKRVIAEILFFRKDMRLYIW